MGGSTDLSNIAFRLLEMSGSAGLPDMGDFTQDAFAAVAPASSYPYRPFKDPRNEIRLLKYKGISQGLASARLCFDIVTIQCPSGPDDVPEPFYAVSYSWGTIPELGGIVLDGHEVDVPYSSEVALRGLITGFERGAGDVNMPIWIDAICMNQNDGAEKVEQLSLMGRLYRCAHTVCVWLGPDGIHTNNALKSLNALKHERETWYEEHGKTAIPPNGILPTPAECNWEALNSILAVPWFTRVWTIQEVVLARDGHAKIFCGRYIFSWDDFAIAIKWAWDTHRDMVPNGFHAKYLLPAMMMIRIKLRFKQNGGVQLSRLLIATISRGATKNEDRVYGLLGMRPQEEADRGAIVPSYEAHLSARYMEAAATIMETEEHLLLLEQMSILNRIKYTTGSDGTSNWPTWVPRLDVQNLSWGDRNLLAPVTGVQPSNANNGIRATVIRSTLPEGLLHLQGIRVGTVERAFEPLIKNKFLTTSVETHDWNTTDVARHFSYLWAPEWIDQNSTRETIMAVADSLSVGNYQSIPMEGVEDNDETMIKDFGAMMHRGWELHPEEERQNLVVPAFAQEANIGSLRNFVERVAAGANPFRHIKLSEGRFGMGPDTALIGDIVVIFLGVNHPMVLRPKGEHYLMLGAAYVSGVMMGEYFQGPSAEGIEARTETFDLC